MLSVDLCHKANFDFGKITKANSFVIHGRLIYVSKKDALGIATKVYIAFDYETKLQLGFSPNKEKLFDMLTRMLTADVVRILDKICII